MVDSTMVRSLRLFLLRSFPVLISAATLAAAELRLPAVFSDHMVLQQAQPIPVWGWADPGAEVSVRFRDQSATTIARADGTWSATLASETAGPAADLIVCSGVERIYRDVLIGEVWIASGQSNMAWTVANSDRADETVAAADRPEIRLFTVPRKVSTHPLSDVEGRWVVATPDTVASFSAVAWSFGLEIQNRLQVPVGLIHSSWGGTPAEAWTSLETLAMNPDLAPLIAQRTKDLLEHPGKQKEHQAALLGWETRKAEAVILGQPFGDRRPGEPRGPGHPHLAGGLYHAMIHPLIPYSLRGAIWYQGESNAFRPEEYAVLFPAMIGDWRNRWGQGDFPFLFVQLANYTVDRDPTGRVWAFLREAQTRTLQLPQTGMAVTIDIGNPDDIHPRNKIDVGKRLALAARSVAYGETVGFSGPTFRGMTVEGSGIRITFDHAGTGLMPEDSELTGFEVASQDRAWFPATATIDGAAVMVRSPEVAEPVAVRYAWRNNPEAGLVNGLGLPAVPFRTDDWPRE